MHHVSWEKSVTQRLNHEKALLDQYIAYHKSGKRLKPKLVVGRKYRTRYPELYELTNPRAKEWKPNPNHVKSREYVPKERKRDGENP